MQIMKGKVYNLYSASISSTSSSGMVACPFNDYNVIMAHLMAWLPAHFYPAYDYNAAQLYGMETMVVCPYYDYDCNVTRDQQIEKPS